MSTRAAGYHIVRRPPDMTSPYTFVVIDLQGMPHLPLTQFGHALSGEVCDSTVRTYISALGPYFTFLEGLDWLHEYPQRWNTPPAVVQECVRTYLRQHLHCKVQHRPSSERVVTTAQTDVIGRGVVQIFLVGIKRLYSFLQQAHLYPHEHPLLDRTGALIREAERDVRRQLGMHPRMPQHSGVEAPTRRISDTYFYVKQETWFPQPIDDPNLPRLLLTSLHEAHFPLRDQIVVRLAFETGARISEILGLTVGDWRACQYMNQAKACNKGSEGRRIKVLRFSHETAKLLRRYINRERTVLDHAHRGLYDLDDTDRLFLSQQGTLYSYKAFRPHWQKLCAVAHLHLNIHGLRHWYVTQHIRHIMETAADANDAERRKMGLIKYMAWQDPHTLAAYEHYFQQAAFAEDVDTLHQRWHAKGQTRSQDHRPTTQEPREHAGWDDLLTFGEGASHD